MFDLRQTLIESLDAALDAARAALDFLQHAVDAAFDAVRAALSDAQAAIAERQQALADSADAALSAIDSLRASPAPPPSQHYDEEREAIDRLFDILNELAERAESLHEEDEFTEEELSLLERLQRQIEEQDDILFDPHARKFLDLLSESPPESATLRAVFRTSQEVFYYLQSLPTFLIARVYVVVHAGLWEVYIDES